jgi:hypothetical protein
MAGVADAVGFDEWTHPCPVLIDLVRITRTATSVTAQQTIR